jgi:cytochrome P450
MAHTYPPGPISRFFGLDLAQRFNTEPLALLTEMAQMQPDLLHYHIANMHIYLVKHPELIHEVLVTQARKFHKWQRQKQVFGKFDGEGLVNSDGEFWKRQRRMIQPAFHSKRIANYAQIMVDTTTRRINQWQTDPQFDIGREMSLITRDIVTKALFNADVSTESLELGEAIRVIQHTATHDMGSPFLLPDWMPGHRGTKAATRTIDRVIMRIIRERRASSEDTGDLLSMLLMAVDESGSGMTDKQARDEAVTLFIAGHETTASALAWVWYLIAAHPEVETKLREEIDALGDLSPTFADLPRLSYTQQIIKETMRLYPPTWLFPREAIEPVELGGYTLEKGSLVHLVPYIVQRDARFFEQPLEFRPERFADEKSIPDYAYFPFGGGPRVCIGNSFTLMEMQLMIATILQRYDMALAPDQGEPEMLPLITLLPKGGVRMQLKLRERAAQVL